MKDKVEELAVLLNESIKNDPIVKEYLSYKNAINQSDLLQTEENLKDLQQAIVNALNDERMEDYEQLKKDYNELKTLYQNNPLFVNYHYTLDNVNELLQQIAFIIDKSINE